MNSSKIREIQYRDFSLDFHKKIGKKGKPIVGQMELTFRCNLKCVHCYVPEGSHVGARGAKWSLAAEQRREGQKTKEELTLQEITGILDQIYQEGCLWLGFTGGEPFMREDFLDIYKYAKKKGFLITILTNGTLMTPKLANYLAEKPPFCIDITVNGVTQRTYENISQVPGSFKKAMEGINLILDRKLPLKIKTEVTKLNYYELDMIKEWVKGLGVQFVPNAMIYPRLDGSLEPCKFRLSPEEVMTLDNTDGECEEQTITEEKASSPMDKLFRCAAGMSSFHISPYGELIFCTFMRKPNFDLRNGSFTQGFHNLYPEIRSMKYQTNSPCRDCRIFYLCAQCPALAMLENGNYEEPVDYFCQLAHKQGEGDRKG